MKSKHHSGNDPGTAGSRRGNDKSHGSVGLKGCHSVGDPLSENISAQAFSQVMKFAELSGFTADQSAHRYHRIFDGGKSSILHDLQNTVHALVHDFSSGFTEKDLTLAHYFGNRKLFFLAESKKFLGIFEIHKTHPPFPYI